MAKKDRNFKDLSEADLQKKLLELREEVRTDRFRMEGAKSKNVKGVKEIKRDIARILTKLNQKVNK